jgi:hypothetical protein
MITPSDLPTLEFAAPFNLYDHANHLRPAPPILVAPPPNLMQRLFSESPALSHHSECFSASGFHHQVLVLTIGFRDEARRA